jgi:hypothetical protein
VLEHVTGHCAQSTYSNPIVIVYIYIYVILCYVISIAFFCFRFHDIFPCVYIYDINTYR